MSVMNTFQSGLALDRVYVKGRLATASPPDPKRLRVLSWNIAHGHTPARIASVLQEIAPDIACLQEVDWECLRWQRWASATWCRFRS